MDSIIRTVGLTKRYGEVAAVESLDLEVHKGEVFGILGPNGSGKTTTLLMLLGLTEPTSGEVEVLGQDPARRPLAVKSRVGYLPDQVGFYDELTARENLLYTASLNQIPREEAHRRIGEATKRLGIHSALSHPVGTFSHGMRQRLGLADVLIKNPELVILDEPTLGLDPEAAREFLQLIRGLKEEGISVLLSSHLLHQVQAVCDRVGLFRKGRMVLQGTVPELARKVLGSAHIIHVQAKGAQIMERLGALDGVVHVDPDSDHRLRVKAERDVRDAISRTVIEGGGSLYALSLEQPSLDDVYERYFEEVGHAA